MKDLVVSASMAIALLARLAWRVWMAWEDDWKQQGALPE